MVWFTNDTHLEPNMKHAKQLIGIGRAAEMSGVSRQGIRKALVQGRLRGWQIPPKLWVVDRADLQRWIKERSK